MPTVVTVDAAAPGTAMPGATPARTVPTLTAADVRESLQPRLPAIVAAWSFGAALLALRMCLGLAWVARLGSDRHGRADARWQARLDALAARMALPRRVLLRVVDGLDGPVVARVLRPVVLVPAALVARRAPSVRKLNGQSSLIVQTFTSGRTCACRRTGTEVTPSDLIGSSRSI